MAKRKVDSGAEIKFVFDEAISRAAEIKYAPRTTVISREEALDTGREFAELVRKEIDPDALVFVFGSTVKREAHLESDIDVAVVSDKYGYDIFADWGKISRLADKVNWRIETHPIEGKEWKKCNEPFVFEVRHSGVAV
jgi:predicted nucleotidyltransferase